jgi:hypothetical protein
MTSSFPLCSVLNFIESCGYSILALLLELHVRWVATIAAGMYLSIEYSCVAAMLFIHTSASPEKFI